ncbi:GNAT family N-acetyltransferase [Legionella nautarum]
MGMAVLASYRGKGIGQALIKNAIGEARRKGLTPRTHGA